MLFSPQIMADMIKKWPVTKELFRYIDVLVDGRFVLEKLDLKLRFRGSSNQRLIDIPKSREAGSIVLWTDEGAYYPEQ